MWCRQQTIATCMYIQIVYIHDCMIIHCVTKQLVHMMRDIITSCSHTCTLYMYMHVHKHAIYRRAAQLPRVRSACVSTVLL
jgi:hypothetical protein